MDGVDTPGLQAAPGRTGKHPRLTTGLGAAALAVLVFALYGSSLPRFWMGDDTQVLKHAATFRPWEYFLVPSAWRLLTPLNLTPTVTALYDLDLGLFGLEARPFLLHHLFMSAAVISILFVFLRSWLTLGESLLVCLLLIVSPAYVNVVSSLMVRHYVEGLFYAVLSVMMYRRAMRERLWRYAVASAAVYVVAALSKEIYVPLPVVFVALSADSERVLRGGEDARGRMSMMWYSIPSLVAFGLYLVYRYWMLGQLIGGYGDLFVTSGRSVSGVVENVVARGFGGSKILAIAISVLASGGVAVVLFEWPRYRRTVVTGIVCCAVPLAGVGGDLAPRHLFLPILLSYVFSMFCVRALRRIGLRGHLVLALCGAMLLAGTVDGHAQIRAKTKEQQRAYENIGNFYWERGTGKDAVLVTGISPWYFSGLKWLYNRFRGDREFPVVVEDLCYRIIVGGELVGIEKYWELKGDGGVGEIPLSKIREDSERCRERYNGERFPVVNFWQQGSFIHWEFSADVPGKFFLVDAVTGSRREVPSVGAVPGNLEETIPEGIIHVCVETDGAEISCRTWASPSANGRGIQRRTPKKGIGRS